MRLSALAFNLRPAHLTAKPATRFTRSCLGMYCWRRACRFLPVEGVVSSLKEIGTEISRPSNSGRAMLMAVSIGPKPNGLSIHSSSVPVLTIPWIMGTSNRSRKSTGEAMVGPSMVKSLIDIAIVLITQSTRASPSALLRNRVKVRLVSSSSSGLCFRL